MNIKKAFKRLAVLPESIWNSIRLSSPDVMSSDKTVEYILENNSSICRYGDGELSLMCGIDIKFQQYDPLLKQRLIQIAHDVNSDKCLVCIPRIFLKKSNLYCNLRKVTADWWLKHLRFTRGIWYKHFRQGTYGDSLISRFYIEVNDKSQVDNFVIKLKQLWDKKNIVFVEGEKSRLGEGNDLFLNANSIRRILCPSVNAFEKYNLILETVLRNTNQDDLIICALGPTATVLCYDLFCNNRRALDLGHIDIEYEWFLAKAETKIGIAGKSSAESKDAFVEKDFAENYDVVATIK